ncbi:hypothetical protein ACOQFL_08485 [Actinopolyspora sp. H202]|uniref:hypothetical protein n=1 Tax=Actinopolyspora sp. H202 TaxID=1500456 RepID=UPI003EE7C98A
MTPLHPTPDPADPLAEWGATGNADERVMMGKGIESTARRYSGTRDGPPLDWDRTRAAVVDDVPGLPVMSDDHSTERPEPTATETDDVAPGIAAIRAKLPPLDRAATDGERDQVRRGKLGG